MSIGTMTQRIIEEIHRASSADEEAVKRAIITAMHWYEAFRFDFNEDTHTFTMTVGQETYGEEDPTVPTEGYPEDLIAPVDMYVQTGGTRWLRLRQIDIDRQRWLQPTATVTGIPSNWAWFNKLIYFTPTPSQADDVRLDYIKDVGIPTYEFDGTSWVFKDASGVALTDSFSNVWITEAEELIRQRAKFDLYFNVYDDDENAQKMDMASAAVLGNLRKKERKRRATERIPTRI